jgi:hypothetical protein
VLLALGIAVIITTVFYFQTKVRGATNLLWCVRMCVDLTSCTSLFCVLGVVVMVAGIITVIVLSFTYVSLHFRHHVFDIIPMTIPAIIMGRPPLTSLH